VNRRQRLLLTIPIFVLIFVVVGAGVARNDLNYTTTAGGLFVIVGYILHGKDSDEDDDQ
jgi:hypothetical protein